MEGPHVPPTNKTQVVSCLRLLTYLPDPSVSNKSKASLISCFCSSVNSNFLPLAAAEPLFVLPLVAWQKGQRVWVPSSSTSPPPEVLFCCYILQATSHPRAVSHASWTYLPLLMSIQETIGDTKVVQSSTERNACREEIV